ncbi:hypothetical protein AZE42_13666 [Rhizopogon vesiculosus]|uniref:Uncharacterized protein n=1 Tax=Rhizopogon vesiculosus TaxID=180088 RepID=A0A1J8R7L7_9AGAM|nr:hypothetical protein AZE42_13666 [Rhizopogon vesiculosus]
MSLCRGHVLLSGDVSLENPSDVE